MINSRKEAPVTQKKKPKKKPEEGGCGCGGAVKKGRKK